jgi:5-methylcytosine-specific restriction endonuclease McrA
MPDPFYNSLEWKRVRAFVLRRDSYTCAWCKKLCLGKSKNGESPVVDHVRPRREFPHLALNPLNMRVLCRTCDNRRHIDKMHPHVLGITPVGPDGFPINSEWSS